MATVRDAITLAESGRTDAARQAFARHVADGAPQAHKSYAIFLQQRGESDAARGVLESGGPAGRASARTRPPGGEKIG